MSPSYISKTNRDLKNAVSPYQAYHHDREKEKVFEKIRVTHYSVCPSRMGAIFLFPDLETAKLANQQWWKNKRNLYGAEIENGSRVMIADSKWLNCNNNEYEKNAHYYFQEKQTPNPLMEVVVMGVVELSLVPINI